MIRFVALIFGWFTLFKLLIVGFMFVLLLLFMLAC